MASAPPVEERSRGPLPASRTRSLLARGVSLLVVIAAIGVGIYLGRAIAYYGSLGDLGGILAVGVLRFVLIGPVIGLVVVGLIATKLRHGKPNLAIWTILAAGGLLAVGAIGGSVTAAATGGLYQAPLVLSATGQTRTALIAGTMPFVGQEPGRADCRSIDNGRAVAMVTALEVGHLGAGTLRATLNLAGPGADGTTAEFWIADIPTAPSSRSGEATCRSSIRAPTAPRAAWPSTFHGPKTRRPRAMRQHHRPRRHGHRPSRAR